MMPDTVSELAGVVPDIRPTDAALPCSLIDSTGQIVIVRKSPIDGEYRALYIRPGRVTREQFIAWRGGAFVQNAFTGLTDEEREFILSGMTPAQWNELTKEPEDDVD